MGWSGPISGVRFLLGRFLVGEMSTHDAATNRAHHGMMPRVMTGNSAGGSTLDAPLGTSDSRRACQDNRAHHCHQNL